MYQSLKGGNCNLNARFITCGFGVVVLTSELSLLCWWECVSSQHHWWVAFSGHKHMPEIKIGVHSVGYWNYVGLQHHSCICSLLTASSGEKQDYLYLGKRWDPDQLYLHLQGWLLNKEWLGKSAAPGGGHTAEITTGMHWGSLCGWAAQVWEHILELLPHSQGAPYAFCRCSAKSAGSALRRAWMHGEGLSCRLWREARPAAPVVSCCWCACQACEEPLRWRCTPGRRCGCLCATN